DYQYIHFVPMRATTDAAGRYEFTSVPMGGSYQIHASTDRLGTSGDGVHVFVVDETPVTAADVAFARRGSLTVTILGPDGRRIDDADFACDSSLGYRKLARVPGVHRVEPIDPGRWQVMAAKSPFVCAFEAVTIAPGDEAAVTLRLTEGGETIAGVVVDDLGAPVAGASVHASETNRVLESTVPDPEKCVRGVSEGRATTDADGRFTVRGLRHGQHTVEVEAPGRHGARLGHRMAPSDDLRAVLARHAEATLRLVPSGGAPL